MFPQESPCFSTESLVREHNRPTSSTFADMREDERPHIKLGTPPFHASLSAWTFSLPLLR